jgi:4-amino-4-deoxy-L-arabinose transferase-like glycosyltransferase
VNGRAGGAERDSDILFGAILFVVALVPRAVVALAWSGEPVWDGHYYDFGARRIAAGLGYSDDRDVAGAIVWHPWCHYPVGYSGFLALFYRVLGAHHAVAAVANSLTGAALAVVTWALARHALSMWRARAAGLLVALHPGLILYAALVMTEPLAALLTLAAFWLAVRDARPVRGLVLGALMLGVAALVRPQALLCAPFLGVFVATRWRQRAVAAVGALVLALLPVLPWTARNCRVMDGCALVSTNAGWNLAIGAFPRATGRFETLHASDGCRDVTGQVEQDRCWLHYGLGEIAARPWRWLALVPVKLGFTFDHESFAVEYLHEARPEAWPESTREEAREATTLAHRVLLAAAALGAVAFPLAPAARSRRDARAAATQGLILALAVALGLLGLASDSPVFWPLAVFAATVPWLPLPGSPGSPPALRLGVALLATTAITHAIFFGEDRYHIVVTPVLAMLAAAALRPARSMRGT